MQDLENLSDLGREESVLYLCLSGKDMGKTSRGDPFLTLELSDLSESLTAKIWHDFAGFDQLAALPIGTPVKVQGHRGDYRGTPQLEIRKIRELGPGDEGRWDPDRILGPGFARVSDLTCKVLVMDIETAPLTDVRGLPKTLVQAVTRVATDRDWDIDKVLGLNPLFSRVVSIAVGSESGDADSVLVAPPEDEITDLSASAPDWMRVMSEKEMLEAFWTLARQAEIVVTYNGRNFDLPFLRTRSAILGVQVMSDLVSQPPYRHRPHLDLYQILIGSGRGAAPMNLDAACFAFNIESPKDAMDGSMVGQAYRERRYQEIAKYNLSDIVATRELYRRLAETVLPFLES